jgi:hypothetical protein
MAWGSLVKVLIKFTHCGNMLEEITNQNILSKLRDHFNLNGPFSCLIYEFREHGLDTLFINPYMEK